MKYVHRDLYYKRVNTTCIKQNTGIQNLDGQAYFDTLVTYPPLPEQQAIADYLDRETAKIDRLISETGIDLVTYSAREEIAKLAQQHANGRYHFFMATDPSAAERRDGKALHDYAFQGYLLENRVGRVM